MLGGGGLRFSLLFLVGWGCERFGCFIIFGGRIKRITVVFGKFTSLVWGGKSRSDF